MPLFGDHFHLAATQGAGYFSFQMNQIISSQAASTFLEMKKNTPQVKRVSGLNMPCTRQAVKLKPAKYPCN
jgi:hypothetical protein